MSSYERLVELLLSISVGAGALGALRFAMPLLQQRSMHAGPDKATVPPSNATPACLDDWLGLLMGDAAAECLSACPSLCLPAAPALPGTPGNDTWRAICAHRAAFSCLAEAAGSRACAPMLDAASAALRAPASASQLEALCAQPPQSVSVALRRAASVPGAAQTTPERSLQTKVPNPLCEVGSPEGSRCVPEEDGAPSSSFIYCTNRKQLYEKSCEEIEGRRSQCKMTGSGLTPAACDDPFCRNRQYDTGDGIYCRRGKVVRCLGEDTEVENSCSDVRRSWSPTCDAIDQYSCVGGFQTARCQFQGTRFESTNGLYGCSR